MFSDDKDRLTWMVNDIIEELMDVIRSPSWSRCGGRVHTKKRMRGR